MPPVNDAFANAIAITLDPVSHPDETVTGSNVGAGFDSVDECYYGTGNTVWWKWTAPSDCHVTADPTNSVWNGAPANFPVIAVFAGNGLSSDCDDLGSDLDWANNAVIHWVAVAGTTYYIQIDSWPAGDGAIQIDFHANPVVAAPNDNVADALVIPSSPTNRSGCSDELRINAATKEPGEPGSSIFQTIWWKWVADSSGNVTFVAQEVSGAFSSRIYVYLSPDGSADFSQFLLRASGFNVAIPNVGNGETYYIQVGNTTGGLSGDVQLCWSLGDFFYITDVDDCPVMVEQLATGPESQGFYPNSGSFGTFTDGYVEWYEPVHEAGALLLFIGIGDRSDSAPAGYTTVLNTQWDNAETDNPEPRGTDPTYDYPVLDQHVQLIIAYRIASVAGGSNSVPAGTYGGITYTDGGFGRPGTAFGARVYSFVLTEMWGDFNQSTDWPASPVKVGNLNSSDYGRELASDQVHPGFFGDPDGVYDDSFATTLPVDDVTADHNGNHCYVSLLLQHGLMGTDWRTFDPDARRTTFDLLDQFYMRFNQFDLGDISIDAGNDANPTIGGYNGYNFMGCQPFLSNRSYFDPFVPYTWVGDAWDGHYPPTHVAENGFSDHTLDPGRDVDTHSAMRWWSGAFGLPDTGAWYYWILTGGAATIQIAIQGPEVHRPVNDDRGNAYDIGADLSSTADCQIVLRQCSYGQTPESGESFDGLGDADNSSVWFRFTPAGNASDTVIRTWRYSHFSPDDGSSTYDTILVVYDSGMNVIASNDDYSVPSYSVRLSQVTLDLVGGETYYIQVAGNGGDEGELWLTVDAEGACVVLPYWGIYHAVPI